ncbi:cobalt-precorrin-8X methylmutase [Synechocystis sp. LKSZ1]|uniref:cobalt-precorrin-8X methylmutase n=1 Tax=Synechocystis sp. LKSZ1 TaxID=3144951 RepID=UPI00336BE80D
MLQHPILEQSFALIDQEVGPHNLSATEYAIARRIIHSTADFDFLHLLHCSPTAITAGMAALRQGTPIITDVTMVRQGIQTLISKTFQNPVIAAIDLAPQADPGKTCTETGLLRCLTAYPQAIYAIGNAPTALLALCDWLQQGPPTLPALVIGAPVGFVSVVESKQALAQCSIPQIRIEGRKGGSSVTAAIINALLVLAHEKGASP